MASSKKRFPKIRYVGARSAALTILLQIHRQEPFADSVIDSMLETSNVSNLDRPLITELVYGVLRHRETLDWRLNHVADRPVERLPLTLAMIFRLGAYQLLHLDRIPPSAAVNESVKLAKTVKGRDWSGMMNAVLRNLMRQSAPAWPHIDEDPVRAFSIRYSCPPWMVERWVHAWGIDRTRTLCESTLHIPPLTLRTNTLCCTRGELLRLLQRQGYEARATLLSPLGITIKKCGDLKDLSPLQEGYCYIEDEAAQLIPTLLDAKPEHHVLDVCAAPGGKTTHISQHMQNQGNILALDSNAQRLHLVRKNAERLGLTNITTHCGDITKETSGRVSTSSQGEQDPSQASPFAQTFDRILVDAPCSGLGTLRRHPEGKWWKGPQLIQQARSAQEKILDRASALLRPGGVLVYSACSIEKEETHDVVKSFLAEHQEFSQDTVEPWLPAAARSLIDETGCLLTAFNDASMDGFFAARFVKGHRT
ncbi:MAG: 16S rRNA (cytosine(967)-C(5))-methyltransferase RsmB [Nitrospirales bacterium]|nr:16S rRNA (cytosine(967)-C(5))-methyltransferase RsmB [Nitrospira sp.]MDR4500942.1 16S rRNA (cytosine(967)-C(5))-methyltransferase RsmB [Nitrospirales bacterium]